MSQVFLTRMYRRWHEGALDGCQGSANPSPGVGARSVGVPRLPRRWPRRQDADECPMHPGAGECVRHRAPHRLPFGAGNGLASHDWREGRSRLHLARRRGQRKTVASGGIAMEDRQSDWVGRIAPEPAGRRCAAPTGLRRCRRRRQIGSLRHWWRAATSHGPQNEQVSIRREGWCRLQDSNL